MSAPLLPFPPISLTPLLLPEDWKQRYFGSKTAAILRQEPNERDTTFASLALRTPFLRPFDQSKDLTAFRGVLELHCPEETALSNSLPPYIFTTKRRCDACWILPGRTCVVVDLPSEYAAVNPEAINFIPIRCSACYHAPEGACTFTWGPNKIKKDKWKGRIRARVGESVDPSTTFQADTIELDRFAGDLKSNTVSKPASDRASLSPYAKLRLPDTLHIPPTTSRTHPESIALTLHTTPGPGESESEEPLEGPRCMDSFGEVGRPQAKAAKEREYRQSDGRRACKRVDERDTGRLGEVSIASSECTEKRRRSPSPCPGMTVKRAKGLIFGGSQSSDNTIIKLYSSGDDTKRSSPIPAKDENAEETDLDREGIIDSMHVVDRRVERVTRVYGRNIVDDNVVSGKGATGDARERTIRQPGHPISPILSPIRSPVSSLSSVSPESGDGKHSVGKDHLLPVGGVDGESGTSKNMVNRVINQELAILKEESVVRIREWRVFYSPPEGNCEASRLSFALYEGADGDSFMDRWLAMISHDSIRYSKALKPPHRFRLSSIDVPAAGPPSPDMWVSLRERLVKVVEVMKRDERFCTILGGNIQDGRCMAMMILNDDPCRWVYTHFGSQEWYSETQVSLLGRMAWVMIPRLHAVHADRSRYRIVFMPEMAWIDPRPVESLDDAAIESAMESRGKLWLDRTQDMYAPSSSFMAIVGWICFNKHLVVFSLHPLVSRAKLYDTTQHSPATVKKLIGPLVGRCRPSRSSAVLAKRDDWEYENVTIIRQEDSSSCGPIAVHIIQSLIHFEDAHLGGLERRMMGFSDKAITRDQVDWLRYQQAEQMLNDHEELKRVDSAIREGIVL